MTRSLAIILNLLHNVNTTNIITMHKYSIRNNTCLVLKTIYNFQSLSASNNRILAPQTALRLSIIFHFLTQKKKLTTEHFSTHKTITALLTLSAQNTCTESNSDRLQLGKTQKWIVRYWCVRYSRITTEPAWRYSARENEIEN